MCNSNLICPVCENKGQYEENKDGEFCCKICWLVIRSQYLYTAGIRFKTLTEMIEDKKNEKFEERFWRMRKCTVYRTIDKISLGSVVRLGSVSDCFQQIELKYRNTYNAIKRLKNELFIT